MNEELRQAAERLTEPQKRFLRRFDNGKPQTVWPGSDTRVANSLHSKGIIKLTWDIAELTDLGTSLAAALTLGEGRE